MNNLSNILQAPPSFSMLYTEKRENLVCEITRGTS